MATDLPDFDEKVLLIAMQNDNHLAFDTLYHKYWKLVFNNAYKRVRDIDLAKDITQEIFLKLWKGRYTANIKNLPAYLHIAVKNAVLNCFEKQGRYTPVTDLMLEATVSDEEADLPLIKKELLHNYESQLKKLTNAQQTIFRMRFDQDDSTTEIAQKLGISRKTVQNQLGKSLILIKEAMFSLL